MVALLLSFISITEGLEVKRREPDNKSSARASILWELLSQGISVASRHADTANPVWGQLAARLKHGR
jgi:hypothetical protein